LVSRWWCCRIEIVGSWMTPEVVAHHAPKSSDVALLGYEIDVASTPLSLLKNELRAIGWG
jgi:hypothetical protein